MKREIKFRVWNKNRNMFIIDGMTPKEIQDDATKSMELPMMTSEDCVWQQYTGLKDKNGVEIYDGDIINNHEEYNNKKVVNYDPYRCYFCLIDTDEYPDILYNGEMFNVAGEGSNFSARLEVIGNIFEGVE